MKSVNAPWEYHREEQEVNNGLMIIFDTVRDSSGNNICRLHDENIARLIAQAPAMYIWIKGMLDCADKGEMVKAAALLEIGHEIIKDAGE